MQRWLLAAAVTCVSATGCSESPANDTAQAPRRPQQAGQSTNPAVTAAHVAAVDAAALAGDQRTVQRHLEAMQKDQMRSMRLADPSRPVDHEAARAAISNVPGVRTSAWIDRQNLMVMVGGASYRSMDTIDRICVAMEPLGDTLGVVVNVQNVIAKTSEEADTLSRNCQLQEGERALFQQKRQVDVLDPETRRVFKAEQSDRK